MQPIRKLLTRELLLLVGLFTAVSAGLIWFGVGRVLNEQIAARSQENLARLSGDLHANLRTVEQAARITARWWTDGHLDTRQGRALEAQLRPLMQEFPQVANLVLVTTDGWGISCLRTAKGLSIYHLDARRREALKCYFFRDGAPVPTDTWEPSPYRVFERPWYLAIQTSKHPGWITPYPFANLPTHGLSYAIPLRDAQGRLLGAVCADIFLNSLTERTREAQPTAQSQVLVTDETGRALILPQGLPLPKDAYQASPFLRPVGPDFLLLFHSLAAKWRAAGRPQSPFYLRHGGDTYIAMATDLNREDGIRWNLCLAVPVLDYVRSGAWMVGLLIGTVLLVLPLGILRARRLAHRFSAPLERLARGTRELGAGTPTDPLRSDILEIASLDDALQRAGKAIQHDLELQMQLQHSQRLETVGTLAGGIAHDVNNQLAAIVGQLNLGREFLPPDHPATRRMESAEEAAERCARMLKGLLNYSHRSLPELKAVDLNEVVRQTATLLERLMGGSIQVDLELAPNLPLVQGDMVSLEQVLMNLALNARDAMPQGGSLRLATRSRSGGGVQLSVKDSGQGIPPELLPRIFDPFFTTKEVGKGTGLGLAMVFSIIKAHQGRIDVSSRPGEGTEFILTLGAAPRPVLPDPEAEARNRGDFSFTGRRILVVEDDGPLRELLVDGLVSRHAEVDTARDGQEGWALWQSGHYELVITDQRMPGLLGTELIGRIRAEGSAVPVILASGYGLEGLQPELAQDPRLRTLAKPFSFRHLFRVAEELLA